MENQSDTYQYYSAGEMCTTKYLWPVVKGIVEQKLLGKSRIMDLGCGNGVISGKLADMGHAVTAIDSSESGILIARNAFGTVRFEQRSVYEDLATEFGKFDVVVSLEVVEHCFWPRKFANTIFSLLKEGGTAIISTPFHGYWKNLALALGGKFDSHWSPLWDGGHIKFWSQKTLTELLQETEFESIEFVRAGRIPPFAKSMIAIARKPHAPEDR